MSEAARAVAACGQHVLMLRSSVVSCRSLCVSLSRDVAPAACHSALGVPGDLRHRVCVQRARESGAAAGVASANYLSGLVCGQLLSPKMGITVGDLVANSLCQVHFWQLNKSLWPASVATVYPLLPSLVLLGQEGDSAGSGGVCLLKDRRLSKTGEFWKKMHAFSERRQHARI